MCNYEVLELLRGIRIEGADKSGKRNARHKSAVDKSLLNTVWITEKCQAYFNHSPAARQTPAIAADLVARLAEFQLTNAELLQIINIRPTTMPTLHPLIESIDLRLNEAQCDALLEIVRSTLPVAGAGGRHGAHGSSSSSSSSSSVQLDIGSKAPKVFLMDAEAADGGGGDSSAGGDD